MVDIASRSSRRAGAVMGGGSSKARCCDRGTLDERRRHGDVDGIDVAGLCACQAAPPLVGYVFRTSSLAGLTAAERRTSSDGVGLRAARAAAAMLEPWAGRAVGATPTSCRAVSGSEVAIARAVVGDGACCWPTSHRRPRLGQRQDVMRLLQRPAAGVAGDRDSRRPASRLGRRVVFLRDGRTVDQAVRRDPVAARAGRS
jgi:hypothetical protein